MYQCSLHPTTAQAFNVLKDGCDPRSGVTVTMHMNLKVPNIKRPHSLKMRGVNGKNLFSHRSSSIDLFVRPTLSVALVFLGTDRHLSSIHQNTIFAYFVRIFCVSRRDCNKSPRMECSSNMIGLLSI